MISECMHFENIRLTLIVGKPSTPFCVHNSSPAAVQSTSATSWVADPAKSFIRDSQSWAMALQWPHLDIEQINDEYISGKIQRERDVQQRNTSSSTYYLPRSKELNEDGLASSFCIPVVWRELDRRCRWCNCEEECDLFQHCDELRANIILWALYVSLCTIPTLFWSELICWRASALVVRLVVILVEYLFYVLNKQIFYLKSRVKVLTKIPRYLKIITDLRGNIGPRGNESRCPQKVYPLKDPLPGFQVYLTKPNHHLSITHQSTAPYCRDNEFNCFQAPRISSFECANFQYNWGWIHKRGTATMGYAYRIRK